MDQSGHQLSDGRRKRAVETQLARLVDLDPAHIGVAVIDSVVVLAGELCSYSERVELLESVTAIPGVIAVVDLTGTRSTTATRHDDIDVARHVHRLLAELQPEPPARIGAVVSAGQVTLHGAVQRNAQRESAQRLVERLAGVRVVRNELRRLVPSERAR